MGGSSKAKPWQRLSEVELFTNIARNTVFAIVLAGLAAGAQSPIGQNIIANPKFQAAIAVWRHCPLWFTNTVGPHLVRAIP